MLTSVISVFFYLRVVVMMYMADGEMAPAPIRLSRLGMAALALSIAAIFYLGILPTAILDLAAESIATVCSGPTLGRALIRSHASSPSSSEVRARG